MITGTETREARKGSVPGIQRAQTTDCAHEKGQSMSETIHAGTAQARTHAVQQGIWIEAVTVAWMMVEAAVAPGAGFAIRSVSLGSGFDM
jgi:hypothetical protein